jgi:hypothetical protein
MYNTDVAIVAAAGILVTIVLPAEYAIDPTGIGRALRLTEMGEIKTQLANEAEADRLKDSQTTPAQAPATPSPDQRSSLLGTMLAGLFVSTANAGERIVLAQAAASRTDETMITLKPTEGVEYKLTMKAGAKVDFTWTAKDGVVNYDMHGTPGAGAKEKSYKNGRGAPAHRISGRDGADEKQLSRRPSFPTTGCKLTFRTYDRMLQRQSIKADR